MWLILIVTVFVLLIFIKLKFTNRNYWKKRKIIQTDDILWKFTLGKLPMLDIIQDIYDKYDTAHIGTTFGIKPTIILKDVHDIQAVLAGDFESFYQRGFQTNSNDILADNLLFINEYHKWKFIRQKFSPVFTTLKIKTMFVKIEKCARDFLRLLETNNGMSQNPFKDLYSYTTASVGASILGIDTQAISEKESPFVKMSWKALQPSQKANSNIFISALSPRLFELLKLNFLCEHENFFIGVVKKVLENRRHDTLRKHNDFLEICLNLQKNFEIENSSSSLNITDELIAAQAFFFFISGSDLTAYAMHFILLELSSNKAILQKVHDDIDKLFETNKEELTYDDIERLEYLDMVVSEGLRKYPPLGTVQRICTKETMLPSNITIEKDTLVIVPLLAIQRDEKYYSSPDIFDPERFRKENMLNLNKFAYLPFGGGNRYCLGSRLARLQLKVGLAWLLRRYTLVEQNYSPKFERSLFALRDSEARYDLKERNTETRTG